MSGHRRRRWPDIAPALDRVPCASGTTINFDLSPPCPVLSWWSGLLIAATLLQTGMNINEPGLSAWVRWQILVNNGYLYFWSRLYRRDDDDLGLSSFSHWPLESDQTSPRQSDTCWVSLSPSIKIILYFCVHVFNPADTRRWINVGLTLVHRLRRWTNVEATYI